MMMMMMMMMMMSEQTVDPYVIFKTMDDLQNHQNEDHYVTGMFLYMKNSIQTMDLNYL